MDPGYETVVNVGDLIWTLVVYVLHSAILLMQAGLALFLIGTGTHGLFFSRTGGPWLRRLGTTAISGPNPHAFGAFRIVLGLLLFAPLVVRAPMGVSLIASICAIGLLLIREQQIPAGERSPGRLTRRAAIVFAVLASAFMLWEGEDNLVLGTDLLGHSFESRNEELAWQHSLDPKSPKVGDLAPDFELQDPEGNLRIRLSDFRGKRPVALIFGSYT